LSQTLAWWRDCIEHWGWLGWHRSLWLRDIEAERAIDVVTDQLLYRIRHSPTASAGLKDHAVRLERDLARLRAEREPVRRPSRRWNAEGSREPAEGQTVAEATTGPSGRGV
jgi:hypothetical protein